MTHDTSTLNRKWPINELTFEWLSGRTLIYSICAAAIGEENIVQTAWINTLISD